MPSQSIEKMFILVISLTMVSIIIIPTIGRTIQYLIVGNDIATLDSISSQLNTYLTNVENNNNVSDLELRIPMNYSISAESNVLYITLLSHNITRTLSFEHKIQLVGFNDYGSYKIHAQLEDGFLKIYFNKIRE